MHVPQARAALIVIVEEVNLAHLDTCFRSAQPSKKFQNAVISATVD